MPKPKDQNQPTAEIITPDQLRDEILEYYSQYGQQELAERLKNEPFIVVLTAPESSTDWFKGAVLFGFSCIEEMNPQETQNSRSIRFKNPEEPEFEFYELVVEKKPPITMIYSLFSSKDRLPYQKQRVRYKQYYSPSSYSGSDIKPTLHPELQRTIPRDVQLQATSAVFTDFSHTLEMQLRDEEIIRNMHSSDLLLVQKLELIS